MGVTDTAPDIDLLDGAFYGGDPHPTYTWMRANAPVYYDAAHNVWGLASYTAVLGTSKDPSTFSNAGGIRPDSGPIPMMIDMDDPEHWKRRKLVNRGFTPRRVPRERAGARATSAMRSSTGSASAASATSCVTSRRRSRW